MISTRVRTSQLRKGSLFSLRCLTLRSSINLKYCYLNFKKCYHICQTLFLFRWVVRLLSSFEHGISDFSLLNFV
ncbi:hypothetical protein RHMOL_Rhmol06G0118100 [Rhododendron molle]|uniref:Uncharacterized protein n=1 Tax=Rhododendron molle TaxID=49168 RepID=A0ACC0NCG1_RHOML|nr:hypothetical protein RHMOL_Rhmol06G0118100 [Rhododendron molle]